MSKKVLRLLTIVAFVLVVSLMWIGESFGDFSEKCKEKGHMTVEKEGMWYCQRWDCGYMNEGDGEDRPYTNDSKFKEYFDSTMNGITRLISDRQAYPNRRLSPLVLFLC